MLAAVLTGFGLGFLVAAQVGPVWLLCLRTSLRHGALAGLGVGAGAAVVDLLYACLGVAGAARLLQVAGARVALGLLGAAVLVALGARTLWSSLRVRHGAETAEEVMTPGAAFRTSLAVTASNPSTIASWAALFTAASAASIAATPETAAALLAGVLAGSITWFTILSVAAGALRRRVGDRGLRVADGASALGIMGFGAALGWRTVREGT